MAIVIISVSVNEQIELDWKADDRVLPEVPEAGAIQFCVGSGPLQYKIAFSGWPDLRARVTRLFASPACFLGTVIDSYALIGGKINARWQVPTSRQFSLGRFRMPIATILPLAP